MFALEHHQNTLTLRLGKAWTIVLLLIVQICLGGISSAWAVKFKLNELGYHPKGPKYIVIEDLPEGAFQTHALKVVLVSNNRKDLKPLQKERVFFEPTVKQVYTDPDGVGPQMTRVLMDFSAFDRPGHYFLRIEGLSPDKKTAPVSGPVKIDDFVYWDTLKPVVRALYFQRCGQSIGDVGSGLNHYACHTKDAIPMDGAIPARKTVTDVGGGWHYSSDYDKQTLGTSFTTARLLALYEWNAKPFQHFKLDYPTNEPFLGDMPDYLHEIHIGLDWLMVMQRTDGGFFQKVGTWNPAGDIRPEADLQERYLYGVTSQDTAAATASLAMASRITRKKDMGYAIKSLRAAEKGWAYLMANPSYSPKGMGNLLPPIKTKFQTEEVSQWSKSDLAYRVWAASELYLTTRKPIYHQYFLQYWPKVSTDPDASKNPAILGMVDYLLYAGENGDPQGYAALETVLKSRADELLDLMNQNPFGAPIDRFEKGSNQKVVESANFLVAMHKVTGDVRYLNGAGQAVNYLFGLNSMGKTFVTGFGTNPVSRPAYRLSVVTKKVPPGLLVSGPNANADDGKTPKEKGAASYVDHYTAKDSNDPAIVYNAGLSFLMGSLNALYNLE